jgi:SHS2 domain-containing protein
VTPLSRLLELQAEAATPQTLIEILARRLFETLIPQEDVGETLREKILVDAADLESLIQETLKTLLGLTTDQHLVFGRLAITEFKNETPGFFSLRAEVIGEPIDPHRHTFNLPVAQITPETPKLAKTPQGLKVNVSLTGRKQN